MGQYDIVINCTGLGSRELMNDTQLVPNRGHLVSVSVQLCIDTIPTVMDGRATAETRRAFSRAHTSPPTLTFDLGAFTEELVMKMSTTFAPYGLRGSNAP